MFTLQHDLDALVIAVLGAVSILWLGRNIYLALKDVWQDSTSNRYPGHTA